MCCCYWEIVAHVVLSFFCCVSCALTLDGVYVTTHSTNIAVIFHQTEWGSQEKGIFTWTFGRKGFHKTAEGRDTGFLGCERITMRPGDFETLNSSLQTQSSSWTLLEGSMEMSWMFSGEATEPNVDPSGKSFWHDCTSSPILFLRCCLALLPWIDRQEYGCAYRSLLSLYHSQQFTISNLFQATMKPKPFLNAVVIQLYNLIVFFLHYTAEDLVIISCLYMLIPL